MGKNLAISVLDLSETGVRMVLKEPLPNGQEVEINLDSLNTRKPVKVLGNVIWVVPTADGSCCVGVLFQRTIPYADVAKLAVF